MWQTMNSQAGKSVGLVATICMAFITLKLTGTVAWSWLWVLSPFWIASGAIVVTVAAAAGMAVYAAKQSGRW